MSRIQIEITDADDQERFDLVLARTLDMISAVDAEADAMISVHTQSGFEHLVKIVKCSIPDVLTFFTETYDEGTYHA